MTALGTPAGAADEVDDAMRLVDVDPSRALAVAARIADGAMARDDLLTAARATRVAALAAFHHQGVTAGLPYLRLSIGLARRGGSARLEGLARMSLAGQLSYTGRAATALREIERAGALLDGADRLAAESQRGLVLWNSGRARDAVAVYADVLVGLRALGDEVGVYTALLNRGAAEIDLLDLAAAEADLSEAADIATAVGDVLTAAYARANIGLIHVLTGDVPRALERLAEAERQLREASAHVGHVASFRSEALLAVRLLAEARGAATEALDAFLREGNVTAAAQTRFVVAQIAAVEGSRRPGAYAEAAGQAARASRELQRVGQGELARLARLLALRATARDPASGRRVNAADVERLAQAAAVAGWHGPAIDGWLLAAELRRTSRPRTALAHWASAARWRTGPRPADLRARAWFAEALRRRAVGDRTGAERAARRGLNVLDEFRDALPATDLRAHAAAHRDDLCDLGTGLALEAGHARRVLRWAELGRATTLVAPPVRPPQDPVLADRMVALRRSTKDLYEARSDAGAPARVERLRARVAALEREIRDLARRSGTASSPGQNGTTPAGAIQGLARALGPRALVEYVAHDGALHAVTLVEGRARLHHLGDLAAVAGLVERIPFAVQRMTRAARSPGGAAAAQTLLADAARRLDAILLGPLRETAGRDLVVVPTGVLQATPWSVLPSCQGRPVTVAPSATVWLAATRRPALPGPVLVAAGPRLRSAPGEARAVAALHGTTALLDPAASVDAVSAALPDASLAHLATHGRLSAENPLFSHLLLSDGPLVVYDLERLDSLPHTVVLAACESGRHVVPAGDELLGLGAAFLAGGTAQLVASVVPVPDAETSDLMTALHARLVAGEPPAVALAAAQASLAGAGPVAAATAAGFVCIGAGFVPVSRPAT